MRIRAPESAALSTERFRGAEQKKTWYRWERGERREMKKLRSGSLPNVNAMIGPISGDTSIEATITTTLFTASPTPAVESEPAAEVQRWSDRGGLPRL